MVLKQKGYAMSFPVAETTREQVAPSPSTGRDQTTTPSPAEVLLSIAADSRVNPGQYLEETTAPDGGE